MSAVPIHPRPRRFSVTEYHRLAEVGILRPDERVELIDGEIIRMSPIGHRHAGIVNRLTAHFAKLGERAVLSVQNPVRVDDHGEPEPDMMLLKSQPDYYEDVLPVADDVHLMIEVGDSTLTYDLNTKRNYYARFRIRELWIVDAIRKVIHVCRDPNDGEYVDVSQKQGEDLLAPLAFPDFVAAVREMIG